MNTRENVGSKQTDCNSGLCCLSKNRDARKTAQTNHGGWRAAGRHNQIQIYFDTSLVHAHITTQPG